MSQASVRRVSLSLGGVAVSLILAGASAGVSSANAPSRVFGAPALRTYPGTGVQGSGIAHARTRHAASCANKSTGLASFDSSSTKFGDANLAAGFYSAVLEGAESTNCDYYSGIVAGEENVIDDDNGGTVGIDGFIGGGTYNMVSGPGSGIGAGGYYQSQTTSPTVENTISGTDSFIGAGDVNSIASLESFVGAGSSNHVEAGASYSGVLAGNNNYVEGSSTRSSVIGGGGENQTTGNNDFVGAGYGNKATADGAFVGGGGLSSDANPNNQAEAVDTFIGAGDLNTVSGLDSFIGAGYQNTVKGEYASIAGGYSNSAKGEYAAIPGGYGNTAAGELSFAAGYHADATNPGSFIWSDYKGGSTLLRDSAANQFLARASGGVYFYSNEAATSGVVLTPGSGTWASLSDRNAKTDIAPLDDESVLDKVAALPIDSWQYKSEKGVRHVGPMAQDFYAAFGTGVDDRHITSIDEDGVALAAIKALNAKLALDNADLQNHNAKLEARLSALEAKVAALGTSEASATTH
jgi:hypothetical protein